MWRRESDRLYTTAADVRVPRTTHDSRPYDAHDLIKVVVRLKSPPFRLDKQFSSTELKIQINSNECNESNKTRLELLIFFFQSSVISDVFS